MFIVIWKFVPKTGLEKEFEKIYGQHGLWTELFKKVSDFIDTTLLKEVDSENVYLVVDRWKSKGAYEAFKLKFFEEYHTMDQRCKDLTEFEQIIGEFNTKH